MSAKRLITKTQIIQAAFNLAKRRGMSAVNARSVSRELKCSTRPIYLVFKGMAELKQAVAEEIEKTFQGYLESEAASGKYPEYKAYGMAYIRFAREEKQLFGYMFMRNRESYEKDDGSDFDKVLTALRNSTGLVKSMTERFHAECWVFVHGIATMLATSYLDLDDEAISDMVTDMYTGLKARYGV